MVLPLLAATVVRAGWLFALLNLGVMLGAPLWGRLVGRVRLDVLEFASVGGVLMAWAAITWADPRGLLAFAFLLGLFGAGMVTLAPCCITCAYPPSMWDTQIARMQTWMMVGQSLGLLVAFLAPVPHLGVVFAIVALLATLPSYLPRISMIGSLHRPCIEPASLMVASDWSSSFSLELVWIRRLLPLFATWYIATFAAAPLYALYPLLMRSRLGIDPRGASLVFALASLLAIGFSEALVHLSARHSVGSILRSGLGLRLAGVLLMAGALGVGRGFFGALAFIVFVNGWIAVSVGFNAALSERTPSVSQGAAFGLAIGLMSIAVILGSILGGQVAQRFGYGVMLIAASGFLLLALVISVKLRPPELLPWLEDERGSAHPIRRV